MSAMVVTFLFGLIAVIQLLNVRMLLRANARINTANARINTTNARIDTGALATQVRTEATQVRTEINILIAEIRTEVALLRSEMRAHNRRLGRVAHSLARIQERRHHQTLRTPSNSRTCEGRRRVSQVALTPGCIWRCQERPGFVRNPPSSHSGDASQRPSTPRRCGRLLDRGQRSPFRRPLRPTGSPTGFR